MQAHSIITGAHKKKERATYSANTLIINDVLPLYLSMNVRHIYLTRITGKFTTASAPGVAQLEYGHPSFHCAPHGRVLNLL